MFFLSFLVLSILVYSSLVVSFLLLSYLVFLFSSFFLILLCLVVSFLFLSYFLLLFSCVFVSLCLAFVWVFLYLSLHSTVLGTSGDPTIKPNLRRINLCLWYSSSSPGPGDHFPSPCPCPSWDNPVGAPSRDTTLKYPGKKAFRLAPLP